MQHSTAKIEEAYAPFYCKDRGSLHVILLRRQRKPTHHSITKIEEAYTQFYCEDRGSLCTMLLQKQRKPIHHSDAKIEEAYMSSYCEDRGNLYTILLRRQRKPTHHSTAKTEEAYALFYCEDRGSLHTILLRRQRKIFWPCVDPLTRSGKQEASCDVILSTGRRLWNAAPSSPADKHIHTQYTGINQLLFIKTITREHTGNPVHTAALRTDEHHHH